MDEVPMLLLALGYTLCATDAHWLMSKNKRPVTIFVVSTIAFAGLVLYMIFHQHEIFGAIFAFEVLMPFSVKNVICTNHFRFKIQFLLLA